MLTITPMTLFGSKYPRHPPPAFWCCGSHCKSDGTKRMCLEFRLILVLSHQARTRVNNPRMQNY